MFQSKKPKSSRGVHQERIFCLHTNTSCSTQSSRALDTLFPRIIAERAIHHGVVMDGWRFGQNH